MAVARGQAVSSAFPGAGFLVLVFGSFLALTVPAIWRWQDLALPLILWLGVMHFFVTFALYLDRENLRYFASTIRNALVYFAIPVSILVLAALAPVMGWLPRSLLGNRAYRVVLFSTGVFHVNMQSFGVLQLLRKRAGMADDPRGRWLAKGCFLALAAMEARTFVSGEVFVWGPVTAMLLLVSLAAFAIAFAGLARNAKGRGGATALAYLSMQVFCAGLAAFRSEFLVLGLAAHYAEYLALMGTRSFGKRRLSAVTILFCGGLLALGFWVPYYPHTVWQVLAPGSTLKSTEAYRSAYWISAIFLFHYFVESFVWKRSDPHHAKALARAFG